MWGEEMEGERGGGSKRERRVGAGRGWGRRERERIRAIDR